jgi:hypothetical protein
MVAPAASVRDLGFVTVDPVHAVQLAVARGAGCLPMVQPQRMGRKACLTACEALGHYGQLEQSTSRGEPMALPKYE